MLCGGLGKESPMNDEIKDMVLKLRPEIEQKFGREFSHFEPIQYRCQVVAGANYYVKIHVGDGDHVHVRIFSPLPCHKKDPSVSAVDPQIKRAEDPIDYFHE